MLRGEYRRGLACTTVDPGYTFGLTCSTPGQEQSIEDIVFEVAERAGARRADELAQELCMIMDGAYVARQVTGDPGVIATARRLADRVIREHLGC